MKKQAKKPAAKKKKAKKKPPTRSYSADGIPVHCSCKGLEVTDELKPNPANPNIHSEGQIRILAKLIKEHGWRHPITVSNRSGMIVAGHARHKAAKLLGVSQVPVDRQDFTDWQTEHAVLVADNVIAELAETDGQIMADLLVELDQLNYDLELTALSEEQIHDFIDGPLDMPEVGEKDDLVPDVPTKPKSKTGDLYILGQHRLLCGDATNEDDIMHIMNGKTQYNVLTDPPYNVNFKYNTVNDKKQPDDYAIFCNKWFSLLQPIGLIFTPGPQNERLYPKPRDKGIWIKKNATAGASIFHLRCCEPVYFYGTFQTKRTYDYFDFSSGFPDELKNARKINAVSDKHPPSKPMQLWIELMNFFDEHSIIDCFAGNGTTLIAGEKTNRSVMNIEIDPAYCDVIVDRWEALTGKKAERKRGKAR